MSNGVSPAVAALLAEPALAAVLALLDRDGEEARVVGGAVRDAMLGILPGEVDIATTATPEEVMRRAGAAGIRTVPTGLAHGTVTLLVQGRAFEVTTLRRDVDTDGRHATVAFARDWAGDARRRDFTVNGLSLSRDREVHDHVGGLADLAAGRVRFIGDPRTRIREDFLRSLRFFRFHAAFGKGAPDAAALSAIVAERAGLLRLSRERVRSEFLKLLAQPGAAPMAEIIADSGIFSLLTGGVPRLGRLRRMAAIEAARGAPPDPVHRLGALALFVAEDAERLNRRLRLSGEETRRLAAMVAAGPRLAAGMAEGTARAALYRFGPSVFIDRALLAWTTSGTAADDSAWHALASLPERWTAPRFPFSGDDLIARGMPRGPRLGTALRRLEDEWVAADFPLDAQWKEAALARVSGS